MKNILLVDNSLTSENPTGHCTVGSEATVSGSPPFCHESPSPNLGATSEAGLWITLTKIADSSNIAMRIVVWTIVATCTALGLVGCSKSPQERILGNWKADNDNSAYLELGKDGALSIHPAATPSLVLTGKGFGWRILEDGKLEISMAMGPLQRTDKASIKFVSDDQLDLQFDSSGAADARAAVTWRRIVAAAHQEPSASNAVSTNSNPFEKDALAFGKSLMGPKLTVCNGRTFAMLTTGDGAAAPYYAEIKNPAFDVSSDVVSQADGLNGLDYHGTVNLRWSSFRLAQHGQWSQWFDAQSTMMPGVSLHGYEVVYVLHKNGQWVHDNSMFGKSDFAGMPRKSITCDAVPKG